MRDGDRHAAAGHALEEDRGRIEHFKRAEARLELLGRVALELRPILRPRDEVLELREHLAAVAHAEREGVLAVEERLEHGLQPAVEEDGARPARTRAEDVAVAEAAARDEALEVGEVHAAREKVRHVDVHALEPRERERRAHLDVSVDALLAQDRDARLRLAARGGPGLRVGIVGEREGEAGIRLVEAVVVFLQGGGGIVAARLHVVGRLAPGAADLRDGGGKRAAAAHGERERAVVDRRADDVDVVGEAGLAEDRENVR